MTEQHKDTIEEILIYDYDIRPSLAHVITKVFEEVVDKIIEEDKKGIEEEMPKLPSQPEELHRCGMGEFYHDYGCPTCGYFLAYEPAGEVLIRDKEITRCQHCGQLIRWGKE